jgi:cell division protein FtsX
MYAVVLAGIIAKGLGVIAGIFFAGMILGVVLTVSVTTRLRRFGRR